MQLGQTAVESDLLCLRIKSKAAQVVNPSKKLVLYRKHISFVRKNKSLILLGLVAVDRALRFFRQPIWDVFQTESPERHSRQNR